MPVLVACPHCNVKLNVPDALLGKKVRCATCSTAFDAKAPEPAAAPSLPAPAPSPPPLSSAAAAAPAPTLEEQLPEAPLDEEAGYDLRRERRSSRWKDGGEDDFSDDDRYDREPRRRKRRRIRRDLEPHRGAMVLTFGIMSVVSSTILSILCCLVGPLVGLGFGLPAVLLGHADLRRMHEGNMDRDGETQTRIGMILGYVGIGLALLDGLLVVAYFVLVFLMSSTGRMR